MQATPKHHHHQTGVFSSAIPQIFSVIQLKLRPWPTSSARGFDAGFTSAKIAGEPAMGSAACDMGQAFLGWFLFPFSTRDSGSSV